MRTWGIISGLILLCIGSIGTVLLSYTYPLLPGSLCTQVGHIGPRPGGFEVYSVGWEITYTYDGVNECRVESLVLTPVVFLILGNATLLTTWYKQNDFGLNSEKASVIAVNLIVLISIVAVLGLGVGVP